MANINIIMAYNNVNTIGLDGGLPWENSRDLKYFKSVTQGQILLFGYKTYLGIKDIVTRKMKDRLIFVVNNVIKNEIKSTEYSHIYEINYDNINEICENIDTFVKQKYEILVEKLKNYEDFKTPLTKIFVAGGLKLYENVMRDCIDKISNIYLTKINDDMVGTHNAAKLLQDTHTHFFMSMTDSHWSGDVRMILKPRVYLDKHIQNMLEEGFVSHIDDLRMKIITNNDFMKYYNYDNYHHFLDKILHNVSYRHPLFGAEQKKALLADYELAKNAIGYIHEIMVNHHL